MKALILGLSTLGAAVDIGKRIARQPLQIAAPKCPVADWPSDTFCFRRWATISQPAFFNRGRVSISLATKGFLFARSRQNLWRQSWDTADIGRKTQVASDGLTKSALIIAYAFRVEMALLCVGYRCWSGRLSAIDLSIGRSPSDRWYGWES